MAAPEVEKVWEEFWKPLLTREGYGVSLELIKNELYDFHTVIQEVPKVYIEITNGAMSKANYRAEDVIARYQDVVDGMIEEAVKEALEIHDDLSFPEEGKDFTI